MVGLLGAFSFSALVADTMESMQENHNEQGSLSAVSGVRVLLSLLCTLMFIAACIKCMWTTVALSTPNKHNAFTLFSPIVETAYYTFHQALLIFFLNMPLYVQRMFGLHWVTCAGGGDGYINDSMVP
mmetsp:Transcript_12562/g.25623  ORF Transcript_12562/g.25623 Transcript_12562/m.25623 type:complete len:127 (+) Transcript_12562:4-384(+)